MRLLCRPRSTARGARQGRGVVSAPQPQITTPQPHHNHKSQRHHNNNNNNNSRSGRINFVRKLAFPGWGDAFVTFGAAWHAVFLVGGCFFFWSASLYIYKFYWMGVGLFLPFFLYIYTTYIYTHVRVRGHFFGTCSMPLGAPLPWCSPPFRQDFDSVN